MNKQIEELRTSQSQQTEEIRKELGGEIAELRHMMEKYFTHTSQQLAKQQDTSQSHSSPTSNVTRTFQQVDPPDRSPLEHSTGKTDPLNPEQNTNPTLPNGLASRLTKIRFPMFMDQCSENGYTVVSSSSPLTAPHPSWKSALLLFTWQAKPYNGTTPT